jgi:hypothetical protein
MTRNKKSNGLSVRQAAQRRKVMEAKDGLLTNDFISAAPSVARKAPHLGETSLGDVFDCLVWDDGSVVEMSEITVGG